MVFFNYIPIDVVTTGKTDPIIINLLLYSNETELVSIDYLDDKWVANLPAIIRVEKNNISTYKIIAYPLEANVSYFPLLINLKPFYIPIVYKALLPSSRSANETKENFTVSITTEDKKLLKLCVNGNFTELTYKVVIDAETYQGKFYSPTCTSFQLPQNPGMHEVIVEVKGKEKTVTKELSYYVPPIFYYFTYLNISSSLLATTVRITVKTYGNTAGVVSFCIPSTPKFCVKELMNPNTTKEYIIRFSLLPYYLSAIVVGSAAFALAYIYFSRKVVVKKEYTIENNTITVKLIVKNLTNREVKGIIIDPLPLGVENVEILVGEGKVREFAGQKVVMFEYDLQPGEEAVFSYKMIFPFEPLEIKLPKPIVR